MRDYDSTRIVSECVWVEYMSQQKRQLRKRYMLLL